MRTAEFQLGVSFKGDQIEGYGRQESGLWETGISFLKIATRINRSVIIVQRVIFMHGLCKAKHEDLDRQDTKGKQESFRSAPENVQLYETVFEHCKPVVSGTLSTNNNENSIQVNQMFGFFSSLTCTTIHGQLASEMVQRAWNVESNLVVFSDEFHLCLVMRGRRSDATSGESRSTQSFFERFVH